MYDITYDKGDNMNNNQLTTKDNKIVSEDSIELISLKLGFAILSKVRMGAFL